MPPKKKGNADANADAGSGEGTWKWTPENDRTLFLLILGRGSFIKEDYMKIAAALSPNVNWNGVRQRISRLRSEQKKKFEELGWGALATGGGGGGGDGDADTPAKPKAPATPRKRKGAGDGIEGGETPSKAKTGRGKVVNSEELVGGESGGEGEAGVKMEEGEGEGEGEEAV